MTPSNVVAALNLPAKSRVDQRVPKKMLLDAGAPTAADKRKIREGIGEMRWVAALKPTSVGIPVFENESYGYLEIAVLILSVHPGAKVARLMRLIHRAIPYPVFLVVDDQEGTILSLGHKRLSQGEAGKMVMEEIYQTRLLGTEERRGVENDFLASLDLARQPTQHLYATYQGWIDRIIALEAGAITGQFAVPGSAEGAVRLRAGVAEYEEIENRLAGLRVQAVKEKQINRRVDLNLEIQRLETKLASVATAL